ncbi:polyhydroxyalkanoate granule-associated phasin [Paraburkholderia fungorum]|uniref:polyhydroxyalkanoate granule-associated phasin n=1 Tax=Paraburkholderia fungorum TaxID=134537 RepID=UPI0038BC61CC
MDSILHTSSPPRLVPGVSGNCFRLFAEVCELLNATSQVVRARTTRMVFAGPVPSQRDRVEFSIMAIEKCAATSESIQAMNSGLVKLAFDLTNDTCNLIGALSTAPAEFASRRPVTQSCGHQATLLGALIRSPSNPLYLASSVTGLAREILAPIHSRATANAKRLGAG